MELTLPPGPPSYEATMSATMNVNPGFADEGSLNSGFNPEDYELPPPYESIANETVQNGDSDSPNVTPSVVPTSNTDTTESAPIYSSINESSLSSASPSAPSAAEPVYEPPPTLDDGGNHI